MRVKTPTINQPGSGVQGVECKSNVAPEGNINWEQDLDNEHRGSFWLAADVLAKGVSRISWVSQRDVHFPWGIGKNF